MRSTIVLYVSGHGFGHATRMAALLPALRRRLPAARIRVRTQAPAWLFTDADGAVEVSSAELDPGMIQRHGLDIDLPASLAAHESFCAGFAEAVRREAAFLRAAEAALVIADIPALAFAAARAAGVPAAGVANFSWDWILEPYAERDARWRPVIARYAEAYGAAERVFRLPMHGEFPAFRSVEDAPLLVQAGALTRAQARARLGLAPADARRVVLVTFGGFGSGLASVERGEKLPGYLFVGFAPRPAGFRAEWRELPVRARIPHADLLAASDAVLSKPGYGTLSECLARRRPLLYLPREDFREIPRLLAYARPRGVLREMSRADFYAGRWRRHLEALFAEPPRWAPPPDGGAERIAARLAEILD